MSQQTNHDGARPILYLTRAPMLCIGTMNDADAVQFSTCRPASTPPRDRFSAGYAWSMAGNLPAGEAADEYVAGLVPADITRVVVHTETGDATAHLAPAPDPTLGQLYWARTPELPESAGTDPQRSRTAYGGTKIAFTCECVREEAATDK